MKILLDWEAKYNLYMRYKLGKKYKFNFNLIKNIF